ncbi:acyl-CoA dehydratase activase-related protein [Clostridium akagii]|uniref:acyl-CoA dehydratase activase-related protein n=1 Tax=Clostridium akagii TaxID=91623 RepID=UPI00047C8FE9|nr:acyl-CoA dehydratase activase-related protein [Clostridium akagii]
MILGIPKGLLYYKYHLFINAFFEALDVEFITSKDTDKEILDLGVKYAVDDACLPIKVFHGHVASLRGKCDSILVPRFMSVSKGEYICPKFCGLPEMIKYSIPNLPTILTEQISSLNEKQLYNFVKKIGKRVGCKNHKMENAFFTAIEAQKNFGLGNTCKNNKYKIALLGHPYNVYDSYLNMNIINKLNKDGICVITEERIDNSIVNEEIKDLFKRPFWNFARNSYGFASYAQENNLVDGIIYLSSFACGIDSIVIELIKDKVKDIPILVLKIDEQTGEAGFDTRIEAFLDMLERRCS